MSKTDTNADNELRKLIKKRIVFASLDDNASIYPDKHVQAILDAVSSHIATTVNEKLEGLGKQIEDITQREFVHGENSQDFDEGRMYEQFQNKEALRSLIRKAKI